MTRLLVLVSLGLVALAPRHAPAAAPAPAASWAFGAEEQTPLVSHGGVHRDVPGPRPPEYPDFEATNTAVKFDGKGAHFSFADTGEKSPFDFHNGDAITLEAWVKVEDLRNGENLYLIGKGRTGDEGFARDNQNWALRLRGEKGKACVSFLFATAKAAKDEKSDPKKSDAHWHRWTTSDGFEPKTGWHHVAATYRFGEPESIRGWIDGKSLPGEWDMGGATMEPPIVDDDAIWIGSSQGGAAGNSFRGLLDAVAIHRVILDDKTLAARFRRVGEPEPAKLAAEEMPELGRIHDGRVLVTFHEEMPSHDRWLREDEALPPETDRWLGNEFLLPRVPLRYDAWGIRESWKPTVLVRLATDAELPIGKNRLLVRARGLSRLWIDGKVVARTKPLRGAPGGEEPIEPVATPPLPGLRPAGHKMQEVIVDHAVEKSRPVRVVLETLVGGKTFRVDPGELTVATLTPDGEKFVLLRPQRTNAASTPLTDAAIGLALARIESSLVAHDDAARRAAASSRDAFWARRHQLALEWSKQHAAPEVENVSSGGQIDAFLKIKIDRAVTAAAKTSPDEAKQFHTTVLPILRNECFRCHSEKNRGGLRLDSLEAALKGGDSETPAIVPGDAKASEMLTRIRHTDEAARMPPTGKGLASEQTALLEKWIAAGAVWPPAPLTPKQTSLAATVNDAVFLRRVSLDTIGIGPTEAETRKFLEDTRPDKRHRAVEQLLADPRWADHWMGYWQDLLAENPNMINATLNSTGPFRWFLYEAMRDDRPLDRLVTELVMMRGSAADGGSAGFSLAAQNDSPFAAKGHIVASAFLGIELQCARCHDSPYHSTMQKDLYALAAMFARKPMAAPKTSSVPAAFFENKTRASLIKVTLKPNESVLPLWPFAKETGAADDEALGQLVEDKHDTRERLAALLTAPQNKRFAQVMVNRIWRRLMGAGIVEPPHDWEGRTPSHPALLEWLAQEFITHDYSIKHITRLIMTSQAYQREAIGKNLSADADTRFFNAPDRRRLTAEQVVDSFFAASGQPLDVEELTLDPDGRRAASDRNTFGRPRRAWMLVSLSNERDRPSLSLPRAAVVADVMEIFGWTAARQIPRTDRETSPNVLQPGVLANSPLTIWLTRAADNSPLAKLAVEADSPTKLVDSIFLRFLGRLPSPDERGPLVESLSKGFAERLLPPEEIKPAPIEERLPQVTWSNHLRSEATTIQQEKDRRARQGPAPDPRIRPEWREVYEDFVWSVVNMREFVWTP